MRLPFFKEEFLQKDLLAPYVDSAAVGAVLPSIVMELKQHQDYALSTILKIRQVLEPLPTPKKVILCVANAQGLCCISGGQIYMY
jgi:hypothetical protein